MGAYRANDALLPPSLLSASRIPLAALFTLARTPFQATLILAVAGATDVLDGWWARRFGQATPMGAAIDPVADKIFVTAAVATLVARKRMTVAEAMLLGVREVAELPLSTWFVASGTVDRVDDSEHPRSNVAGKVATTLQIATLAAAALRVRRSIRTTLALGTAIAGALAAASYVRREVARAKAKPFPLVKAIGPRERRVTSSVAATSSSPG